MQRTRLVVLLRNAEGAQEDGSNCKPSPGLQHHLLPVQLRMPALGDFCTGYGIVVGWQCPFSFRSHFSPTEASFTEFGRWTRESAAAFKLFCLRPLVDSNQTHLTSCSCSDLFAEALH